jgi:hypothetical protein
VTRELFCVCQFDAAVNARVAGWSCVPLVLRLSNIVAHAAQPPADQGAESGHTICGRMRTCDTHTAFTWRAVFDFIRVFHIQHPTVSMEVCGVLICVVSTSFRLCTEVLHGSWPANLAEHDASVAKHTCMVLLVAR